jgi:threonine/homoserine/homoserine lactone efflux protein
MDIKLISALLSLHFLALISPGPDFFITLKNTLEAGKQAGRLTALGIGLGIAVHVGYCAWGVGLLLKTQPELFSWAKLVGSLYLFYLGSSILFQEFRTAKVSAAPEAPASAGPGGMGPFAQGFLTNLLNPKATLFILGLFTSGIPVTATLREILTVSLGIVLITISWFVLVASLFGLVKIRKIYFALKRPLNFTFGGFFILAALLLFRG